MKMYNELEIRLQNVTSEKRELETKNRIRTAVYEAEYDALMKKETMLENLFKIEKEQVEKRKMNELDKYPMPKNIEEVKI